MTRRGRGLSSASISKYLQNSLTSSICSGVCIPLGKNSGSRPGQRHIALATLQYSTGSDYTKTTCLWERLRRWKSGVKDNRSLLKLVYRYNLDSGGSLLRGAQREGPELGICRSWLERTSWMCHRSLSHAPTRAQAAYGGLYRWRCHGRKRMR